MRSYAAAGVLLLFPALGVAACSSANFETLGAVERIAEPDWIDALVEAQCQQQMSCDCYVLAAPEGQDPYAYQLDQCRANRRAELEHHMGQMHAHGMHYDGACAASKLAAMKSWGCADSSHIAAARGSYLDQATTCRVYFGDALEGELCDENPYDSCGAGLACFYESYETVDGFDSARHCRRLLVGSEGSDCGDARACAPSLYCDYQSCRTFPQVGEACPDGQCAPGAGCDFSNGFGVCRALVADGEACGAGATSCLGVCDESAFCAMGRAAVCTYDARNP